MIISQSETREKRDRYFKRYAKKKHLQTRIRSPNGTKDYRFNKAHIKNTTLVI